MSSLITISPNAIVQQNSNVVLNANCPQPLRGRANSLLNELKLSSLLDAQGTNNLNQLVGHFNNPGCDASTLSIALAAFIANAIESTLGEINENECEKIGSLGDFHEDLSAILAELVNSPQQAEQLLEDVRQARLVAKKLVLTRNAVHTLRMQALDKIENKLLNRQQQLSTISIKVAAVLNLFKSQQNGNQQQMKAIEGSIASLMTDINASASNIISNSYNASDCPLLVERPRYKQRGEISNRLGQTVDRCVDEFQKVLDKIRLTVHPLVQKRIVLEQELIHLSSQEKTLDSTHQAEVHALSSQTSILQAEINELTFKKNRIEQCNQTLNTIISLGKQYIDFNNSYSDRDTDSYFSQQVTSLMASRDAAIEKARLLLENTPSFLMPNPAPVSYSQPNQAIVPVSLAQLGVNTNINTVMPKTTALLANSQQQMASNAPRQDLNGIGDKLKQNRQRVHDELLGKMIVASQIADCFVQEISQIFASLEDSSKHVEKLVNEKRQNIDRIKQQQKLKTDTLGAKIKEQQSHKASLRTILNTYTWSNRVEKELEAIVYCRTKFDQCTIVSNGRMTAGFLIIEIISYIGHSKSSPFMQQQHFAKLEEYKQRAAACVLDTKFNVCTIL